MTDDGITKARMAPGKNVGTKLQNISEILVEDQCCHVEERPSNTRYHLANTDDSYRVRLEQQLNQIIDLRTDDLGTVSNKIISAYFKNDNVRF